MQFAPEPELQSSTGDKNALPVASDSEWFSSFIKQFPRIVFSHGMDRMRISNLADGKLLLCVFFRHVLCTT